MKNMIAKIQSGDRDAYREVVLAYAPQVHAYLAAHISDFHTVQDLSQEIFLSAWKSLDSYDCDKNFFTWLRTIARNKLMTFLRTQYSDKYALTVVNSEIVEQVLPSIEAASSGGDDAVELLKECIEKQDEENMALIKARYFTHESVIEIATRLGSTVSAISSQLYRIRKQLRICIERSVEL